MQILSSSWQQATLPISSRGLGICLASDLTLPYFLSSIVGTDVIVKQLLPARLHCLAGINDAVYCQAVDLWVNNSRFTAIPDRAQQRAWDGPLMRLKVEGVLIAAHSQSDKARLIAALGQMGEASFGFYL